MKYISNFKIFILSFFILIFVSGCGIGPMSSMNHSTNTQVVLSKANFRVINSVSGSATARYFIGIGPSESKLIARAKQRLMRQANLTAGGNKSRALINITTDETIRYIVWPWPPLPLYVSKTVYVTADVIEFIPENY